MPTLETMFAAYGEVAAEPLSRMQALTAKAMSASWTTVPHVTHFDRLDVTDLESARRRANAGREKGEQLSPVPYLIKAIAGTLQRLPRFNAIFDQAQNSLVQLRYVNIGLAIAVPAGLVVGAIRGCDALSVDETAQAARALGEKARAKGLALSDMTGAGFTVSSLGNLGGDGFTPIVNAPQVAILGVGRLEPSPRKAADGGIEWRDRLPVALSYDHRVINGVEAGQFMAALQSEVDRLAEG